MVAAVRNGKGFLYINGSKPWADPQGFDFKGTITVNEWVSGEVNTSYCIPTGNTYELTVKLKDWMCADFLAMMTGSASETAQSLLVRDEAKTIPATPFAVTLANADNVLGSEVVVDVLTGLEYERVTAGPTTGQYTIAVNVLTFAAADTLRDILITYTRENASAGEMVQVDPDAVPSQYSFDGYAYLYNIRTKAMSTQMHRIYLAKCQPKGDFTLGYKPNDVGETEVTFTVTNDTTGDIKVYYPDKTYHATV